MVRDTKTISAEARRAFAKRDRIEAELRAITNHIHDLKSEYMIVNRTWGLRDERFREEITPAKATKAAA